jgi:hypothetical protein
MMDRNHVLRELSSYLDNQESGEERQRIEEHLKVCRTCSQELSRLKTISEKLKAWQAPDAGPFFEQAVKDKIASGELERSDVKMKNKPIWYLIPSGVAAGILVLLLVGPMYMHRGFSGRLRSAADDMGEQYDASKNAGILSKMTGNKVVMARQYEPNYLSGTADVAGKRVASNIIYGRQDAISRTGAEESTFRSVGGYGGSSLIGRSAGKMAEVYEPGQRADYAQLKPTPRAQVPFSPPGEVSSQGESSVIIIQPVLPATGEGDKIIRTAEIRAEVENGQDAYKKASEICRELGGYLAASNQYQDREGRDAGTVTMRIPKDKFLIALDKLGGLGKIEGSSSQSQDVGQDYANLKSRLDAAMVVYNKMLEALQKRQVTIPEAARLESELTPVLERVQELKNKIEYLNNLVSFTTITFQYHEPRVSAKALKDSKKYIEESILTAKINGVKFLASAIPAAIVIVFWVIVTIVVAALLKFLISLILRR